MTRQEHLLIILAEECAEVAHRCSKALRFGLGDVAPGQPYANHELIRHELCHVAAVLGLLAESGAVSARYDVVTIMEKRAAIEKWLEHSKRQGTLTV